MWVSLASESQLKHIVEENSASTQFIVFKHSTRCGISVMVKRRFEQEWSAFNSQIPIYIVDVLAQRNISNTLANYFNVIHQSPQLLLIQNNNVVFHASHHQISASQLIALINKQ